MSGSDVTRTPDGRHVVVDGRRWRATDPGIPEALRAELVRGLMAARRAVRDADDDAAVAAARGRVQDAKVALGERGEPWWEAPSPEGRRTRVEATARTLLEVRGEGSSICPSDVGRVVGGEDWRDVMDPVRDVLWDLADAGELRITQGEDTRTDRSTTRGPIRIRLP